MNWEATQAVAELVAALAVLGSLGYLAVQIRQNTASVQAGTVAKTSQTLNGLRSAIWTDAESARLYELALSGAPIEDTADATRVRLLWITLAREYEATYYQHLVGQLPAAIWEGWAKEITLVFGTPGGRDALLAMKDELLSAPFAEFLERRLSGLDEVPSARFRRTWAAASQKRRVDEQTDDAGRSAYATRMPTPTSSDGDHP